MTCQERYNLLTDWAMTQNNLGNALWTLGGREAGTERLEEAVEEAMRRCEGNGDEEGTAD